MADLGFNGGLTCAIECADLQKSIDWYAGRLDFQVRYRIDDIGWCELDTPVAGVLIGLSQVETPQVTGGATLTFGVEDIDSARKALEQSGVRFDGDTMTIPDQVKLATFFDPDGNKLMLYQSLGEAP